jgi:hypothetical protein
MKVNAPEKLYLIQHNGLICYRRNNKDDIEYTRTDAFIEKACDYLDSIGHRYIIDAFRKYMVE